MKNNILRAGFVMAVAATATFGLSACGSSDNGGSSSEATSTSQAADDSQKNDSGESEAFVRTCRMASSSSVIRSLRSPA